MIVNDYLRRLAIAASRLSVARRSETIKEIAATVYVELSRLSVVSPTAVVDLFARIGQPEHLAKRAAGTSRPDIEAQRHRVILHVALAMVVVGAISCVGAFTLGMSGARHSGHHRMVPAAFGPASHVRPAPVIVRSAPLVQGASPRTDGVQASSRSHGFEPAPTPVRPGSRQAAVRASPPSADLTARLVSQDLVPASATLHTTDTYEG